mgnify:CR=1 FL=1
MPLILHTILILFILYDIEKTQDEFSIDALTEREKGGIINTSVTGRPRTPGRHSRRFNMELLEKQVSEKRVSDSVTDQIQILMPSHINGFNRLFGGKLVEWIDVVAGVVARRHSNCNVTTAQIDSLHFKGPAYTNDTVVLSGRITYVGRTSMEVRVDTFVESLKGERRMINRAYLVMVALDEEERPVAVPRLILETEEDQQEWQAGERRNLLRKQRRTEGY